MYTNNLSIFKNKYTVLSFFLHVWIEEAYFLHYKQASIALLKIIGINLVCFVLHYIVLFCYIVLLIKKKYTKIIASRNSKEVYWLKINILESELGWWIRKLHIKVKSRTVILYNKSWF